MIEFIYSILILGIPFSISLLLASLGEMYNQRAGIFNLGCEGIMSMGAFIGFLVPFLMGGGGAYPWYGNVLGIVASLVIGALLGLFFAVVVVTFKAPQGIAGIGLQMFGVGVAGTLFRHFVGGIASISGIHALPIPLLSKIPLLGNLFFNHNPLVYIALLLVPLSSFVLNRTSWGLKVRACGTTPRAADSVGINVNKIRYQSLVLGGALAGMAGAYLSLCQVKMFADTLISGRGFIAVALVYFGKWTPWGILWGSLLFSLTQVLQLKIQTMGINVPYEFAVMLPYVLVILVLAFSRKSKHLSPMALGIAFDRENRL
ncbi:ABC transporter permease [Oceanispirochaeta crateris]|uniref:ABC transporter permease n=1 Tax=Oceanispirochaeta crateris TaxID=2518645 RepID=UPI001FECA358|nr:ABC transporter permease [Oceanispirochaeta crateris]